MTSPPLGSTHGQTTSGVASHHRLCTAHTVERRRAWHAIIAFGHHTRSNDVERGIPLSPLGSTHGRTTSGVACHHCLWEAQKVERRREWHANITFGQHTRSNDVWRSMPALPLGSTRSKDVGRGITSPHLDSAHARKTSSATCHHCLWTTHTVELRRAWHAIIAFGQHTRSNDVRRGMPSLPLDTTHGQTTSSVSFHYRLWAVHTVELHQAWHAIIAFGKHKKMNDVGRGMKTSPLGSTHGQTTSGVACQHRLWAAHSRKTSGVA